MADIGAEVARLNEQIAAAQRDYAGAMTKHGQAAARSDAAAAALAEEFGVSTPEAARELADQMETELREQAARVRGLLARAGGQA
jgi:hypothetical protein